MPALTMPQDRPPSDHREPLGSGLETHFASPARLTTDRLQEQLQQLAHNPLLDTLLKTVGGLLAVLNEHRQILATNENLLTYLGVGSAEELLGLRLGEAIACPHAGEMAAGCGTSLFCKTCGAAIAQAVALHQQRAADRFCTVESARNGTRHDLVLRIRATPVELAGQRLILIFAEDVTRQQQSALAERAFHHDLNNTLTSLLCAAETLASEQRGELAGIATEVQQLTERIARELDLQRRLIAADPDGIQAARGTVRLGSLLDALRTLAGNHPTGAGKRITIVQPREDVAFVSDDTLVLRVLANMAINALEATHPEGEVRIHAQLQPGQLVFRVWNEAPIPPEVALRIFQRNFSTKGTLGRGLGTYSMKLVGEQILHGRVSFESSAFEGTTFTFVLPV